MFIIQSSIFRDKVLNKIVCTVYWYISHKLKLELLHVTNILFQWLLKLIYVSNSSHVLFKTDPYRAALC